MTIEFLNKGSSNKTIKIVSKNKPITLGAAENTTAVLSSDSKELTFNLDSGNPLINTENKIFGNASFETKSLGDSLYTNSNVITGGSTPFTIEFYALVKNLAQTDVSTYINIISGDHLDYTTNGQGLYLHKTNKTIVYYRYIPDNLDVHSNLKISFNDINKITMTYDGACIRVFINDVLDIIVGTSSGFIKRDFLSFFKSQGSASLGQIFGLVDNVNIHDGIATKVRDPDPYEEFLVVDLAFDGENNSTKIVDNGKKLDQDYYNRDFILNYKSGLYDISKKERPITVFGSSIINNVISLYQNQYLVTYINPLRLNDFTIESYVAYTTNSVGGARIFELGESVSNRTTIVPKYESYDGVVEVNNVEIGTIPYEYRDGVYRHHCLMRKNGIFYYFVDGSLILSHKAELDILATKLTIGAATNAPVGSLQGSMSYFRISNSAIYSTTGFLYPTEIESENKWIVNGNAKISTDQKFEGFSSLYLSDFSSNISTNIGINFSKNWTLSFLFKSNIQPDGGLFTPFFKNITDDFSFGVYSNGVTHKFAIQKAGVNYYFEYTGEWFSDSTKVYKIDLIKSGDKYSLYIGGVLKDNRTFNIDSSFSDNVTLTIGPTSVNGRNFTGYYKNFKIYKDVEVIPEDPTGKIQLDFDNNLVDKYGNSTWTNNGVTFDRVNSVKGYSAYFNYNSSKVICNNSILDLTNSKGCITFDAKIINKNTSIGWDTLITSGDAYSADRAAVAFSPTNNTIRCRVSSDLYVDSSFNYLTNTYYNINIIKDNYISLVVVNDCIISTINSNLLNFNSSNQCTIGGALYNASEGFNGYIDNFKAIKDYQEEIIIDRPAVHLPLETNSTNLGFTPLVIQQIGTPVYHVVDNKKCAEFIAGRYISINDHNIFKMGIESDFYFECMFYTSYRHTDGFGQTLINNGTDNQSNGGMWIQINSTQQSNTGHISIAFNNQTFATTSEPIVLSAWNKLVFKRKNKEIFLILNDVITKVPNFDVNFSKGGSFTIGQVIGASTNATFDGQICDIKMFVGTSEIPETYNDKKVLHLDFKPTRKSYLFKDNYNKCVIHPVNITQRDYQNSKYCCTFNSTNQYLQLGKNDLLNFGKDDFVINIKFKISDYSTIGKVLLSSAESSGTLGRAFISIESTTSSATRLRSLQILTTNSSGASVGLGSSNDVLLNEINNVIITRSGSKLTINLNGVITSRNDFNEVLNFNLNNNTYIGWRDYQSQVYLDGTIYSINILRNTSDIELLEKEEDDWVVNEGYKLEGNNIKYTGYKVYNENIYDSYAHIDLEEALVRSFNDEDMRSKQAFIDAADELTGVTDWTVDIVNNQIKYYGEYPEHLFAPTHAPNATFTSAGEACTYYATLIESFGYYDTSVVSYTDLPNPTCTVKRKSSPDVSYYDESTYTLIVSSNTAEKEERYIPFDILAQKIISNSGVDNESVQLFSKEYIQEVANSLFNSNSSKRFVNRYELIPQFEVNKKLRTEDGGSEPTEPVITDYTLTAPFIDSILNPERGSTKTITGTIIGIKEQPIVNLTINNSVINNQEILIEKVGDNYLFTYELPLDNYEGNISIVIVTQAHNITKSLNRIFTISREYDVPLNKLDLFGMSWGQQSNTNKVLISKNNGNYNLMFKNGSALYSYNKHWTFGLDVFTIEFDINITNFTTSGYNTTVLSYGVGGRYNGFYSVEISPTGYITFGDDTFKVTSDTSNIKINTNHRVAVTRDTNKMLRMYVDGVKVLERSFDINLGSTISSPTDSILILGKRGDNLTDYNSNRHFTGYLANVYINKGVCLYSDSSYILEPKTISVAKSLLTFNTEVEGNINDSYNTNLIWTNTGCTASDLGLTFNNTNSRLVSQKSDLFNINGVDSWTIDLVVRPSQTNEEVVLLDTRALVTDYKGIVIRQPGNDPTSIQILIGKDTDEYDYSYKMNSGINSLEPWKDVRIKLVKSLNNIYLFINGEITQTIDVGFDIIPTKDNWILGNSLAFDKAFKGHLKQFRFIKHVATNIRTYTNTDEELV